MFNKIVSIHSSGNYEVEINPNSKASPYIKGKRTYTRDSSTRDSNARVLSTALPSAIKVDNEVHTLTWKVFWFRGAY